MKITWHGHSAFTLEAAGKNVLVDPFLTGNPSFVGDDAAGVARRYAGVIDGVSHVVITHGHSDHTGDAADIAIRQAPKVFCNYDLGVWLMGKVAAANGGEPSQAAFELMNTGGTVENDGVSVTLTRADHSSGALEEGVSHALGSANGAIIRLPGAPVVWHMGDTDAFSDMAMIDDLWKPEIVIMPIGDRFTMGPKSAAYAASRYLAHAKMLIPCHWGTFGLLTGTPDAFRAALGTKGKLVADFALGTARQV